MAASGERPASLAARLAAIASRSTCRLTHRGRRTGRPWEVTIWFVVDGDVVYLVTASAKRQWVRNVRATPSVSFTAGGTTFAGTVEPVRDPADVRRIADLVAAKHWYLGPPLALARLLGFDPTPAATFRVRVTG